MRLSLLAVTLLVVGSGCAPKCDLSNCNGCCDETGACVAGTERTACGRGGETCNTCNWSRVCATGVCTVALDAGEPFDASVPILDGGTTDMDWAQYCAALADAEGARYTRCGVWTSATQANRRAELSQQCLLQDSPSVKKGRIVLVPPRVQTCLARINASPCTELLAGGCTGITEGRLPLNSPCFEGECEPTLYCNARTTCPGRCVPGIPLGTPVAVSEETHCAGDAYSYNGVCTARAREGQNCAPLGGSNNNQGCEYGTACLTGTVCEVPTEPGAGEPCPQGQCGLGAVCRGTQCQPYGDLGDACDAMNRCRSGRSCVSGFCVDAPPIPLGMWCPGGNAQCEGEAFCDGPQLGDGGIGAGSCTALRGSGGVCTRTTFSRDRNCQSGLYCTAPDLATPGTCVAPAMAGGACVFGATSDQCIFGTYCTAASAVMSGLCAPRKVDGALCSGLSLECRGLCSTTCSGSFCSSFWESP